MRLRNFMETVVEKELTTLLSNFAAVCRCDRCALDIKALSLNNLPARYIVSERGLTHAHLHATKAQFQSDVLYAVTRAIQQVGLCPRHSKREICDRLLEE